MGFDTGFFSVLSQKMCLLRFIFKNFTYINIYVCVHMCMCVYVSVDKGVQGSQKTASDPLELYRW